LTAAATTIVAGKKFTLKKNKIIMKKGTKNNGAVFLIVVFAIALIATITMGILVMTTEEVQLMNNQLNAAKAMCTAEAGLNDAFAQIRSSSAWTTGFAGKAFHGDTYTVTVTGTLPNRVITSTATTAQGYTARVAANITVGTSAPYIIRIDSLRINEI
jgi:type II secretory pathway component PulK